MESNQGKGVPSSDTLPQSSRAPRMAAVPLQVASQPQPQLVSPTPLSTLPPPRVLSVGVPAQTDSMLEMQVSNQDLFPAL